MKRFLQGVDFIGQPKWALSYLFAVFLVCVGLCVLGFYSYAEQSELGVLIAEHDALQNEKMQRQQPIEAVDLAQEKAILEQYSALQAIRGVLANDVQVFSGLEMCVSQDFAFLAIKPNPMLKEVSLVVEVRNIEQLRMGLECLEATEAFAWIRLQNQQRVLEDVQQPLRVELLAGIFD